MPSRFVSAHLVPSGEGNVVRRAGYNARQPIYVEGAGQRYRPRLRHDHLCGGLLVPASSVALGTTIDHFWNNLEAKVGRTRALAVDLILGLPREDELELSEAVRMIARFVDPIVARGHAVQWDVHSLPRDASIGSFRHAHILISLFGLDHFKRIRRLETEWTPVFRHAPSGYASRTLVDWQHQWAKVQSAFFHAHGLDDLRVPVDIGVPEISLGPRKRMADPAAQLALARHRAERQIHYEDDLAFVSALSRRLWLFNRGDVLCLLRSIYPATDLNYLDDRSDQILARAIPVSHFPEAIYGTEASIAQMREALVCAHRLANASDFVAARRDEDGRAGEAWEPDLDPVWRAAGPERLAVIVGSSAAALIDERNSYANPSPVGNLIDRYLDRGLSVTVVVPDLRSRRAADLLSKNRGLRCETIAGHLAQARTGRAANRGELIVVIGGEAVGDQALAALLANVEASQGKLVLTFDHSAIGSNPTSHLALALMDQLRGPIMLTPRQLFGSSWNRFSWDKLAAEFDTFPPFTLAGYFDQQGLLDFAVVDDLLAKKDAPEQIIVGDAFEAAGIRARFLAADTHRTTRLLAEPGLSISGEPSLLMGDIICLAGEPWGVDQLLLGRLGRLSLIEAATNRIVIDWNDGARDTLLGHDRLPLVHAGVLPMRLAQSSAALAPERLLGISPPLKRAVYISKPSHTERLMHFAAEHGGLSVIVDPAVAPDRQTLVDILAACRPVNRLGALAQAIIDAAPPAPHAILSADPRSPLPNAASAAPSKSSSAVVLRGMSPSAVRGLQQTEADELPDHNEAEFDASDDTDPHLQNDDDQHWTEETDVSEDDDPDQDDRDNPWLHDAPEIEFGSEYDPDIDDEWDSDTDL